MVRKFGGPGAAFLLRKLQSIKRQIEQDKVGLGPVLMRSHNDVLRSKQLEKGHAIIRVNPEDAKTMGFVKSIYGEMYKDLDDILKQEDGLSNKSFKNMSHLVVLASILESGLTSWAVMEHAWTKGWSETGAAMRDKLFGDEKERVRQKASNAIASLVRTNDKLEARVTYLDSGAATKSWWRWFFRG